MPTLPTAPRSTREEAAATFALAWPLILSNLAANAITTTDVLMLGWLGPEPLAAAALAVNLYNLLLLTGVGLSVAISPMIAAALGRRKGAARDSRRSFRMGLWLVSFYALRRHRPPVLGRALVPAARPGTRAQPLARASSWGCCNGRCGRPCSASSCATC
jgi:hypothetical protein